MENSKIEWTDHTFNPWIGCTKVSDGCKHCYAEMLMDKRYGRVKWGPQGVRVRTSEHYWDEPRRWQRKAKQEGRRYRIFCASLADVFEEKPDQPELDEWRKELFGLIGDTPDLDWLLLTKRPENVNGMFLDCVAPVRLGWEDFPNIWVGVSVENQKAAWERIPQLLTIPATVKFVSLEPLLEPVDISIFLASGWTEPPYDDILNWVIVGGESGPNARPMHPDWVRSLRSQCRAARVPFFFKQWGDWIPVYPIDVHTWGVGGQNGEFYPLDTKYEAQELDNTGLAALRVGKKLAGRRLDGCSWDEFPSSGV